MKPMYHVFLFLFGFSFAQQKISDADVMKNINKEVIYCNTVYGNYASKKVVLLNLGAKYPNQKMTVAIFQSDWKKFSYKPAEFFKDKTICVSGKLILYKDMPEIIVNNPKQITVQ